MPRGTTPEPMHRGHSIENWARMARRMNSLLFLSLPKNSARSSSTLNATILVFCVFRATKGTSGEGRGSTTDILRAARPKEHSGWHARAFGPYECAVSEHLIVITDQGLYCPAGDFHIDPWRPVDRALITHAHADHARVGSGKYLCAL